MLLPLASCSPSEEPRPRAHPDAATARTATPPRVREAASAGQFYPGTAEEIRSAVDALFAGASPPPRPLAAEVQMVLVPHAGWEYSGVVGATALATLSRTAKRVVILAANHNGDARFSGVSVERSTIWRLPGLEVKVDPRAAALLGRPGFVDVPEAHGMHMIESELPLVSHRLGHDFSIVPLIVGRLGNGGPRELARELAKLHTPDTVFVISVDLSHYYPYERARELDGACLAAIERMDAAAVAECDTDGTQVLLTMVELAALKGWTPRLLRAQTSGDIPDGDRGRVVGYGAMAFEDAIDLSGAEEQALLELARASLEARVRGGSAPDTARLERRFPRLGARGMAFVTLRVQGDLRGCIGSLEATQPLAADVVENAAHAAVDDRRFRPVGPAELDQGIDLSISVLSEPRPLDTRRIAPDALAQRFAREHPGVVLAYEGRHSTFLPSVWEEIADPIEFLGALCRKQGSAEGCWREPGARYETYGAEHFGEAPARLP